MSQKKEFDFDWNDIYQKSETVVTRQVADEVILVPIKGEVASMKRIFALDNPVAQYIWEKIDGRRNMHQLLETVLDVFAVEEAALRDDLAEFIAGLRASELIFKQE